MRTFGLALAAVLLAAAAADALELNITVTEPSGVARVGEPVSGGIPLPAGQYKPDQPFALFDGEREVPVQALPLVIGEGGDLRWVLLDFQADLAAGQARQFTLKAVKPTAAPASPLKLTETADAVAIDTGKVKLTISKSQPFGLFDAVEVGGMAVVRRGGQVRYTDGFEPYESFVADVPSSVEVEYSGPMRATVCVKGRFVNDDQTKLGYVARITAWAGRSDVHVKYSLANSNPDHYVYRRIKDSSIALALADKPGEVTLGADKLLAAQAPADLHQGLAQGREGSTLATSGGRQVWSSEAKTVPLGFVAANVGGTSIGAADLYFSDDPARKLAVTGEAIVLTGVAERFARDITDRIERPLAELNRRNSELSSEIRDAEKLNLKDKPAELKAQQKEVVAQINDLRKQYRPLGLPHYAKYRWLLDCTHLSSFYVIDFAAGEGLADWAKSARDRLHAMAPPAWYSQTEGLAVGRFGTQADELKCYDTWGWKYDPKQVPTRPAVNDRRRYIRGEDNHYETEEDIVESLMMMYLRTGSRAFYDYCLAWANYNMDLQPFRTNGWRYKDGGVWWTSGGPMGSSPQRGPDPVTGLRNSMPSPWSTGFGGKQMSWGELDAQDCQFLANSKACYCHNWGEGLAGWFLITGDRDALETAIDNVEQNLDTQARAFRKAPGKTSDFSRDFTRAAYLTNATRMALPQDEFLVAASDFLARVYLDRPVREYRGLIVPPAPIKMDQIKNLVGDGGLAEMKKLGVELNPSNGMLIDPKTWAQWHPVANPHTWMFPPLANAMDCYYRITGDEDARDWTIAYGQAVGRVLFQPEHGNLYYGKMLVDFPTKGVAKDWASWNLPPDSKHGEGIPINGYLAEFHPDVCAIAYSFSGEPFLKQRAYDYWYWGSHRGYNAVKMHNVGGVGKWVNYYGVHSESVNFTGRTFHVHAHPRADAEPPAPVADLTVTVNGDRATVSFTAPADRGGGQVVRYQVKCAEKSIVDYEAFLELIPQNKEGEVCNWWMAANVAGEPVPGQPGQKVSFEVSGVPEFVKFFAVRSFDDSDNRSPLSNVVEAK